MVNDENPRPPLDLEVYRRVAERHSLIFERVHGSFVDAARYLMTQWDTPRSTINKALRSPGQVFWEGDHWTMAQRQVEFEAHGIVCQHQLTQASPWAKFTDHLLSELLFKQGWSSMLGPGKRLRWLHNVRAAFFKQHDHFQISEDSAGRVIHLESNQIEDDASFYLAMGEAVHGPGGYLGACVNSFLDCFCGGFGIKLPMTLHWPDRDPRKFEDVVWALQKVGVDLRE